MRMRPILQLQSLLLLLASVAAQDFVIDERVILKELYEATGGDSWQDNEGWTNPDSGNICNWYGVYCVGEDYENNFDANGNELEQSPANAAEGVIALSLSNNNLNGRTPESLWKLPRLESIRFNDNTNLNVDFVNIEMATSLRAIRILNTATLSFAGISKISHQLQIFKVAGMELNSVIPEEIWSLTELEQLVLAQMQLQGTLSTEIGNLRLLEVFNLYDNSMDGSLPTQLGNLVNLRSFTLSLNQFTGTLPTYMDSWGLMTEFYVEGNQFTGTMPMFSDMAQLEVLFLSNNFLTGNFPPNFMYMVGQNANYFTNGVRVDVADNKLTGEVPGTLDILQEVELYLNIQDNQFTSVDQSLCDNVKWDNQNPETFGCDAILCPIQTFHPLGRRTHPNECQYCETAQYMGQTTCSDRNDAGILELLYDETGGDNWFRRNGWKTDQDFCTWYGIICWDLGDERDGRVRHIHLDHNNLVGSIPQNVYALETLTTMTFSRNQIVLPFTQISNSPHMHHINIASTSTTIFDGIGQANSFFKHLIADRCLIQGTIPKDIYDLTSLDTLSMAECELTGRISPDMANMKNLTKLYLYGNNLRGNIPDAIGQLVNLDTLSLAKNQFTGVLPKSLENLPNLQSLSLTDQVSKGGGISGEIPDFAQNKQLVNLILSKNRLEGTLPSGLLSGAFDLNSLLSIDVSHNLLSGTVPGAWARFDKLDLKLDNNLFVDVDPRLCSRDEWQGGNVKYFGCDALLCPQYTTSPTGNRLYEGQECVDCNDPVANKYLGQSVCGGADLFPPTERQILELFYDVAGGQNWKEAKNWMSSESICEWYGIECDEGNSVVSIVMGNNDMTGTIPTEIYQLPNLNRISLFSNEIEFDFTGLEKARNLRELVLDSTKLQSLEGIGKGRALRILNVRASGLEGEVPHELSRLVNLQTLIMSDNKFEGTIPEWLNSLPSLEGLMLARNRLGGTLPDFGGFESVLFLDLASNQLEGTIPTTFLLNANVDAKVFVDLSFNQLTGTVPGELSRLNELVIHLKENALTGVSPQLCDMAGWNNGAVGQYGCDAILCPSGTYNSLGRQQSDDEPCLECDKKSKYMGSIDCSSSTKFKMGLAVTSMTMVVTVCQLVF